MPKKKTIEEVCAWAKGMGYVCLSTEYAGIKEPLLWVCPKCSKEFTTNLFCMKKYGNCKKCGKEKADAYQQAHKTSLEEILALNLDGILLSPYSDYKNQKTKLLWKCNRVGHEFRLDLSSVKAGKWCRLCGIKKRADSHRMSYEDLVEAAAAKEGRCISEKYIGAKATYTWQCAKGHTWKNTFAHIRHDGQWCPHCNGHAPKTSQWLHELGSKMGFQCQSTEYIDSKIKYDWKCKNGHIFAATTGNILAGWGCRHCSKRRSKAEIALFEYCKQFFDDILPNKTKLFPSNPGKDIDIYRPSVKRGVEYDGNYWHSLEDHVKGDKLKNKLCKQQGIKLLRVKESDYKANPEAIKAKVLDFLKG